MLETLLDCVALFWVEDEHLAKEVEGHRVRLGVKRGPGLLVALGQLPDVFPRKVISDESHVLARGSAEHSDGPLDLIQVVVSWEEGRPTEKFREDAPDGPDIQGVGVVRRVQNDFRGTVPTGNDIFCQSGCALFIAAGKTEIADFEIAILIKQEVTRFQIAMNNIGRVDVEATAQ